jgi:hypothetical protein
MSWRWYAPKLHAAPLQEVVGTRLSDDKAPR